MFIFLYSLKTAAQDKPAPIKKLGGFVTEKFPSTRIFDVQYEQLGPTYFSSKLLGNRFEDGKIESHNRFKAALNMPFFTSESKKIALTGSLRYKYESYGFGQYRYNTNSVYHRGNEEYHYFATSVSATYISKLFNKTVIYNATATVDADKESPAF